MFRRLAVQAIEPGIRNEARVDEPRQERAADEDGRKHADNNPKSQVDSKAFDCPRAHDDEDNSRNHNGYVRIEDGIKGPFKACFH